MSNMFKHIVGGGGKYKPHKSIQCKKINTTTSTKMQQI